MLSFSPNSRRFKSVVVRMATLFLLLLSGQGIAQTSENLPWKVGDSPLPGWRITAVKEHREFLRFTAQNGPKTTAVEIVSNKNGPGEWRSRHYRIQPGPNDAGESEVLLAMFETLKRLDEQGAIDIRFTPPTTFREGPGASDPASLGVDTLMFVAPLILALLLFLIYLKDNPELRLSAGIVALAFLGLALADLVWFSQIKLPLGFVTALQKGWTEKSIRELFGEGGNSGPSFWRLGDWVFGPLAIRSQTLGEIVRLNIHLAVINIGVFFLIARALTKSGGGALILTLLYVLNPMFVNAAFSELPVMFLTLLFFLCVLGVAVFNESREGQWLRRLASLLFVSALVAMSILARGEMALVGLPLLGVLALRFFGGKRLETFLKARLLDPLLSALHSPRRHWRSLLSLALIVFVLPSLPYAILELMGHTLDIPSGLRWLLDGVRLIPFNFPRLFPLFLHGIPLGLLLLFCLGLIVSLKAAWRQGLWPIFFIFLCQVFYSAAAQGWGEMYRYLMYLLPGIAFFAAYGYGCWMRWLPVSMKARRWRLSGAALFFATVAYWPLLFTGIQSAEAAPLDFDATGHVLAAQDMQIEVRHLSGLLERYPNCLFLAPAMDVRDRRNYWIAFDAISAARLESPAVTTRFPMADVLVRYPKASCIFLYRSLDCNHPGGLDCDAMAEGRPLLHERVFGDRPYSDIDSYVPHEATIRLGLYRLR